MKHKFYSPKGNMHEGAAELLGQVTKLLFDFIEKLDLPVHTESKIILDKIEKSKIPMDKIERIVNKYIPDKWSEGLRTINRDKELIRYKHITWYILRQMGYLYPEIKKHFHINHSTGIHAYNKIKGRLQVNDKETMRLYYIILNAIQENHDRDI